MNKVVEEYIKQSIRGTDSLHVELKKTFQNSFEENWTYIGKIADNPEKLRTEMNKVDEFVRGMSSGKINSGITEGAGATLAICLRLTQLTAKQFVKVAGNESGARGLVGVIISCVTKFGIDKKHFKTGISQMSDKELTMEERSALKSAKMKIASW